MKSRIIAFSELEERTRDAVVELERRPMDDKRTQEPWNKGRPIGQKRPLKLQEIWAIRVRLQLQEESRDLALFNLAIDSKLRGCDLVNLKVSDVMAVC